uniref:Uncharacterized protein n=1 Tax=Stomoxys calcitrans TaxID=35570 RepID=A0A1I8P944_STOCA
MFRVNIFLVFGALLCLSTFKLAEGNHKQYLLNVLSNFMDTIERQRNIMICMASGCDPLAMYKIFDVEDLVEVNLKTKFPMPESNEVRSIKLAAALNNAVERLLKLQPECYDATYSCPHEVHAKLPAEVFQYMDMLGMIVATRDCINEDNVERAIDVLGTAVAYAERNRAIKGHFTSRVIIPTIYVTKEYQKLCYEL